MTKVNPLKKEDIVINSEGFGLLRKALIKYMGQKDAKKFLFQFGYQMGVSKAKEKMKQCNSLKQLVAEAPKIHIQLQHVSKVETFGTSLSFHDKNASSHDVWGIWYDSFEVRQHLENHGLASECMCYTLCGFASGYLTTIHNIEIYVYEATCRSKGDEHCTFKIKTREECERLHISLDVYNESTIVDELEVTYEQLYKKTSLLDKVSYYHSKLTDAILEQKDFSDILKIAHGILHIPIYLTNAQGQLMYSYGLNEDQLSILNKNTAYFRQITKSTLARIKKMDLITMPIYLNNAIYATVSFIYIDSPINEDDYLFLERLSVVSSLCILNDKVRFETTERLKFTFLDRLIHGQFVDEKEMLRYSQFIQPVLQPPFTVVSIKYEIKDENTKPFDIYNQIFQIARILGLYQINGLISQKNDHLVLLLYNTTSPIDFTKIIRDLTKTNSNIAYKVGISDSFEDLQQFNKYMTQAEHAMNFPRPQSITHFHELGLLGTIISQMQEIDLNELAIKELGELITERDKNQELLQTLYTYLKNNGHLEKTMQDLSLSIGGIKYRINKIEKILKKDLKNALTSSYLLLLIECLLVLHEIKFN